jgi:membrane-bound metal-dependent hydrolase YbcI (DUF457 family)
MFLGHFGLAFAAKRLAPRTSLGTLGAASQWVDLVWPILLLAGIEEVRVAPGDTAYTALAFESYPWTHSLLMAAAWALALGLLYRGLTGDRRAARVVGALVLSHWVLDWVTHRPDLPLAPWGAGRHGLGLWNWVAGTVLVEGAIFVAGVALYATGTRARGALGRLSLWGLVAFLGLAAVANFFTTPPGPSAVAWGSLSMWLLVLWMAWVDRLRQPAFGEATARPREEART